MSGRWFLVVMLVCSGLVAEGAARHSPSDIGDLRWMAGSWRGTDADGLEMEEIWIAPAGGTMLGMHRDIRDGRTVSFEFLRIASDEEGLVFWASPQGRAATPFRLSEQGARSVVFANPSHDFPQRIRYWFDDASVLHARVEGEGGENAMNWTWQRDQP